MKRNVSMAAKRAHEWHGGDFMLLALVTGGLAFRPIAGDWIKPIIG